MDPQKELILTEWLRKLTHCKIPFENTQPIQPFEVMCVFDHVSKEHFYCPYLNNVNNDGTFTIMTFFDPTMAQFCDFAYTAPTHWVEKLHSADIRFTDVFRDFQSRTIINYITVFMNQLMCYSEDFILYHGKMSKDGPNPLVEQLVLIYSYICKMVAAENVEDLTQRLSVAVTIVDSFFEYFQVPKQMEIVFMASERVRDMMLDEKHLQETVIDTEVWKDIIDFL